MKKFIAMMLVAAFLLTNTVGCGGETPKPKDKEKAAPVEKEKAAPKEKA